MSLKNKKKRKAIKAPKNKSSLTKLASITTNTLSRFNLNCTVTYLCKTINTIWSMNNE